ncbi:hypothetical protein EZS27_039526 [termite gut metagenome]|uniref:Uncharacterized protein n=1 Tax=termite gut metagenome TaxID=433724 RepID=A0A5J4PJ83_9ZZZZ
MDIKTFQSLRTARWSALTETPFAVHEREIPNEEFILSVRGQKPTNLSLGQVKVDEKSNEITAIPKLLNILY